MNWFTCSVLSHRILISQWKNCSFCLGSLSRHKNFNSKYSDLELFHFTFFPYIYWIAKIINVYVNDICSFHFHVFKWKLCENNCWNCSILCMWLKLEWFRFSVLLAMRFKHSIYYWMWFVNIFIDISLSIFSLFLVCSWLSQQ